jgi:TolA-binding protein
MVKEEGNNLMGKLAAGVALFIALAGIVVGLTMNQAYQTFQTKDEGNKLQRSLEDKINNVNEKVSETRQDVREIKSNIFQILKALK